MKKLMICILVAVMPLVMNAQRSREYIRNEISRHGECRNVAITKTNGDLMLYGSNGWAATGCPSSLTEALDELNEEGEYIDDVQLTEKGRWLILYGNNAFRWNYISSSLETEIREYNRRGDVVTSVTFNDDGDWIVISKEHFSASDNRIVEWLKDGLEEYGQIWSACVTDSAIVAVFENGYKFLGDVPSDLKSKLDSVDFDVYRMKIAGTAWFISDGVDEYDYSM